ncbi:MAG: ATP:cob(I)alamin adenosyltransferase [Actinobacteria bacterium HGW-Actinobacteria-2]|nr:MAG: ATP:cob(I)alamin adenosyltransferase [Actinobacteria bacterium HGW-Actinobacteria-2]
MVKLTRIYTRTGDAGTTRLSDNSETAKTDPRVQAYGHVDEANSMIGVVLTQPGLSDDIAAVLTHVQNELFDCGADLSNPLQADESNTLRVIEPYVSRLESWCDQYSQDLPDLPSFVLPGGTPASAWLQVARTVVRRAERTGWAAASVYGNQPAADGRPGGVNLLALAYLNRLSDLLFILARVAGQPNAEVLWVPGKDRQAPDPTAIRSSREHAARPNVDSESDPESPTASEPTTDAQPPTAAEEETSNEKPAE